MPSREGGRVPGGWRPLLVGLVLVTGCGAGTPDPAPGDAVAGVRSTASGETATATGAEDGWQAVRIDEMAGDRSNPEPDGRNPFRFGAPRRAAPRSGPGGGDPPGPSAVPVRGGSPPDRDSVRLRPGGTGTLPLTFIGFVESPGIEGRVVVLTDGEIVFHGRVGDVIDGRYRIVGLGLESVDVERVDGQGQQTLRLPTEPSSGS